MSIAIKQFHVGGFDDNLCYVMYDEETKQAFIVDATGDLSEIFSFIETSQLKVLGVLLTHTHVDHLDKLPEVMGRYDVPVYVHQNGVLKISAPQVLSLGEGDRVPLGGESIIVLHTPGHIEDAVCFYVEAEAAVSGVPLLITGDTLFVEGCGRTTESQVNDLYDSLIRLKALPDSTILFPGHDYGSQPTSTIAHEKDHNKYLLAKDFAEFKALRIG